MDYGYITTEYLCYLMNRVGLEAEGVHGYLYLCQLLHEIPFEPQTAMDENRSSECHKLREDFQEDEYGEHDIEGVYVTDILNGELPEFGTMFELLIVLAEKMQFEMSDSQYEASTRKWFLEMLCNCGISEHWHNEDFDREGNEEAIRDIVHSVIFRQTGWDGEGGLFPLVYPQYDQRRVELIIQMNNYLEENYDIC